MENKEMNLEQENKTLVVSDDNGNVMTAYGSSESKVKPYCSFIPANVEDKIKLYNAQNSPDFKLSDYVNKKIALKNIYCEMVNVADTNTGELKELPRVVLIDKDFKSYQCCSKSVLQAIGKIIAIFGEPKTWTKPVTIEVKNVSTNSGYKCLTLAL